MDPIGAIMSFDNPSFELSFEGVPADAGAERIAGKKVNAIAVLMKSIFLQKDKNAWTVPCKFVVTKIFLIMLTEKQIQGPNPK